MMPLKSLLTSICALAVAGATLGAAAAELGEIAPRSYIGQPLAVDIDLVALTPEEVAGLQVRLADGNVYRGANVTMNPALASVRLQVERRGARSVLHVTTTRAVDADYVHLYVELGVPGKQDVRLATVWLQRDPNPPAPVVVAPVAPAVPPASAMTPAQAEQIAAQARAARLAASGTARTAPQTATSAMTGAAAASGGVAKPAGAEAAASGGGASGPATASAQTAAQAANAAAGSASSVPVRDRSKPAPLPSVHESETGVPGEVKAAGQARRIAGVWVGADGKVLKTAPREETPEVPVGVAQALLPLAPLPLPKGVKRPAPVSCAPSGISAKECVALDNHNAELSSKLLELEGKMKVLQGALGGASPAAISAAAQPGKAAAAHGAVAPATAAPAPASAAATASQAASASAATKAPAASAALAASVASGAAAVHGESAAKAASSPAGATSHGASAAASLSAQGSTEMNAAKAAAGAEGSASASAASASASSAAASASSAASSEAASVPTGPVKQIRVLPKLKYKKEKPPETQTDYTMPLVAGAVGLLALLGAGFLWWRKKKSGRGPLQIWQGFRKKKPATPDAAAEPAPAPAAESVAS